MLYMGRCSVVRAVDATEPRLISVFAARLVLWDSLVRGMARRHGNNVCVLSVDTFSLMQTHGADCISTWLTPWLRSDDNMSQATSWGPQPSYGSLMKEATTMSQCLATCLFTDLIISMHLFYATKGGLLLWFKKSLKTAAFLSSLSTYINTMHFKWS